MNTDSQVKKHKKNTNKEEVGDQDLIYLSSNNTSPACSNLTASSTPVGTHAAKPINVDDYPTPFSPEDCGELRLRGLPGNDRPSTPFAAYMDDAKRNIAAVDKMVHEYLNYNQEQKITIAATEFKYFDASKKRMGPMQSTTLMNHVVLNTPDLIQHKVVALIRKGEKKLLPSRQIPQVIHLVRILNPMKELLSIPIERVQAPISPSALRYENSVSKKRRLYREEMKRHDKVTIASLLCLRSGTELRDTIVDSFMFLLNYTNLDDEYVRLKGRILAWPYVYLESRLLVFRQGKLKVNPTTLFTIHAAGVLEETMATIMQRYAYIAFPLVQNGHWTLCVFETSSVSRKIHFFDSMGNGWKHFSLAEELESWLRVVIGSDSNLPIENRDCPRQPDTKMCGVCVCRTVDSLFAQCHDDSTLTGICESVSRNTFNTSIEADDKFRLEMLYWHLIMMNTWAFAITSHEDVHTTGKKKPPSGLKAVPTPKRLDPFLGNPRKDTGINMVYLTKLEALVCAMLYTLMYNHNPGYRHG
jgi:hypothetical protein